MAYLSRAERRAQIIDAAAEILATQGIMAATVRAIATRLDCSPGQIHHHFRTADDLRAEALQAVWRQIGPQLVASLRALPPRARLLHLLAPCADLNPNLEIIRRLWIEVWDARSEPSSRLAIRELTQRLHGELTFALREGMACGLFPAHIDAEAAALRMMTAMQGFAWLSALEAIPAPHDARDIFAEGLLVAEGL